MATNMSLCFPSATPGQGESRLCILLQSRCKPPAAGRFHPYGCASSHRLQALRLVVSIHTTSESVLSHQHSLRPSIHSMRPYSLQAGKPCASARPSLGAPAPLHSRLRHVGDGTAAAKKPRQVSTPLPAAPRAFLPPAGPTSPLLACTDAEHLHRWVTALWLCKAQHPPAIVAHGQELLPS